MVMVVRWIAALLVACLLSIAPGCETFLQLLIPLPLLFTAQQVEKVPALEEDLRPLETLPIEPSGSEEIPADKLTEERAWELLERTNSAVFYLQYYFADRQLLDEENVYLYYPAVDPGTQYPCMSIKGVKNLEDFEALLRDDFTYRYVQERFMQGLFWDEQNAVYIMEGKWFDSWQQEGIYLLGNWASGDVRLLADTLQIAETGENTYKISAEMEYDMGRLYCDVVWEDGVYKVTQSHEGTGQPDYGTAKALLARAEQGGSWLLYHFSADDLVNWDDTCTVNVMEAFGGEQLVEAYAVNGIDTPEDLRQALSDYYTEERVAYYLEASYETGGRRYYNGDWFEENGTIYFMPNWGMGGPMTDYQTTRVEQIGENRWEITADAEYETTSSCQVVYDEVKGKYLIAE